MALIGQLDMVDSARVFAEAKRHFKHCRIFVFALPLHPTDPSLATLQGQLAGIPQGTVDRPINIQNKRLYHASTEEHLVQPLPADNMAWLGQDVAQESASPQQPVAAAGLRAVANSPASNSIPQPSQPSAGSEGASTSLCGVSLQPHSGALVPSVAGGVRLVKDRLQKRTTVSFGKRGAGCPTLGDIFAWVTTKPKPVFNIVTPTTSWLTDADLLDYMTDDVGSRSANKSQGPQAVIKGHRHFLLRDRRTSNVPLIRASDLAISGFVWNSCAATGGIVAPNQIYVHAIYWHESAASYGTEVQTRVVHNIGTVASIIWADITGRRLPEENTVLLYAVPLLYDRAHFRRAHWGIEIWEGPLPVRIRGRRLFHAANQTDTNARLIPQDVYVGAVPSSSAAS